MHLLEQAIFDMYKNRAVGTCPTCQQCRAAEARQGRRLSKPVSFWHIGSQFHADPMRVVFVGKNAVDGNDLDLINDVHDASTKGAELYRARFSDFWMYIEKIMCDVLNTGSEDALSRIAITNLMKCNHSDGQERKDTTSPSMKTHCVDILGVLWSELNILNPRNVIFFTHKDSPQKASYDAQISHFMPGDSCRDLTDSAHTILNGRVAWWDREFIREGKVVLRLLRTSHPQGKGAAFVDSVADWIRQGKQ